MVDKKILMVDKTTQLQISVTFQRKQRCTKSKGWGGDPKRQNQDPNRIFPTLEI